MNKKDLLYKLFQDRTILTSSEVTNLGYARIYLTMLEKEKSIYKVSRGVYSINKGEIVDPLYEFQKNNKKIIYSCFSALNLAKFYHYKPNKLQVSVPQGYNASRYKDVDVFYNNDNNYGVGTVFIDVNGHKLVAYNIERSICDIIKEQSRFDTREYNKLINYYFNLENINYSKLLEYSKLLKVSKKVQSYLSLFKA